MVFENKNRTIFACCKLGSHTVLRQLGHISLENLLRSRLDSFVVEINGLRLKYNNYLYLIPLQFPGY